MKTLAKVRTTVYLDPNLYKDLKIQAVLEGESMSDLLSRYTVNGLKATSLVGSGQQNDHQ